MIQQITNEQLTIESKIKDFDVIGYIYLMLINHINPVWVVLATYKKEKLRCAMENSIELGHHRFNSVASDIYKVIK